MKQQWSNNTWWSNNSWSKSQSTMATHKTTITSPTTHETTTTAPTSHKKNCTNNSWNNHYTNMYQQLFHIQYDSDCGKWALILPNLLLSTPVAPLLLATLATPGMTFKVLPEKSICNNNSNLQQQLRCPHLLGLDSSTIAANTGTQKENKLPVHGVIFVLSNFVRAR